MSGGCIIHNLGSGQGSSVLEMVKAFEAASGKTIPYKMAERRPGDLACVVANPAKAKADFGWETTRGLELMCSSSWHWQSSNPNGYEEESSDTPMDAGGKGGASPSQEEYDEMA